MKSQLKSHGSTIFIIPEETKLITRCFQFQFVNLHHKLFLHHNSMYAVISATRRFDDQCKYLIVKAAVILVWLVHTYFFYSSSQSLLNFSVQHIL